MKLGSTNVLLIEPSFSCLDLLPAAKRLGCRVLVLSANSADRYIPNVYRSYIDKLIIVDTNNTEQVLKKAQELNEHYLFKAVIPGSEYHVVVAAYVAEQLKLPGHPVKTVNALREKHFMRECLKNTSVTMPAYSIVNSKNDLTRAAEQVGFPAVIKPVAMAGSLGVKLVNNRVELEEAYQEMTVSDIAEMERGVDGVALLEECVRGKEYSVEGYISDGKVTVVSITEKFLGPEPHFVEMGHIVEANLKNKDRIRIIDFVQRVITELKLCIGVFHLELIMDSEGPALIEIAGRLPGDHICDLIKLAKGVDLAEVMVQSHLNSPINLTVKINGYAGICYFSINEASYESIEGWDEVRTLPDMYEQKQIVPPNQRIDHPETFHGRIAYVIFNASTYDVVRESMRLAQKAVKIRSEFLP